MRILFIIITLLAASLGFLWLSKVSGPEANVVLNLSGSEITISFMPFIILAIIVFFAIYYAIRFLAGIFGAPKKVGNWNKARNQRLSQTKMGDGFLSLMKGDWKKAEKQLLAKSQHSEVPYVNYLAAAQAAQEQGKFGQRDKYLDKALAEAPKEKLAINMTRAKLHQQAGNAAQALQSLKEVEDQGRKSSQYVAMLVQAYDELNDNESLQAILPQAKKMGALPDGVIAEVQAELDLEKFDVAENKEQAWKELAKTSKKDPDFIGAYAEYQIDNNRPDVAEKLIRTTLKTDWDESLVNVYGRIKSTNRKKLLRQVEGWLLARPESAESHLAAGRLAMQDRDIERAQLGFEQAIKLANLPEAFEELGMLHESEQDLRKALTLYRTGMASKNGRPPLAIEEDQSDEAKEGELLTKD